MWTRVTLLIILSVLTLFMPGFSRFGPDSEAGNTTESSTSLIGKAKNAWVAGSFELAATLLNEALRSQGKLEPARERATCLMNLGLVMWDLGEIQESARHFGEAIPLFQEQEEARSESLCRKAMEIIRFYNLGKENRSRNRSRESLDCFDKAINLGRGTGFDNFELKCLRQKSLSYWQLGDMKMFLDCNKRGLEIAKRLNHRREVGRCMTNIGVYYEKVSDYSNALRYLTMALPVLQLENELDTEAQCLNNIGLVYKQIGEFNKAIRALSHVLEIDEKTGDHLSVLEDRANLGSAYLRRGWIDAHIGDVRKAIQELSVCLDLLRLNPYREVEFGVLTNLGFAYCLLHQYDRALNLFADALKISSHNKLSEEYSNLNNNIANAYYGKGQLDTAIKFFMNSINLCEKTQYLELLWEAYLGLGRCYEAKKEPLAALDYYKKSIEALESTRRRISLDTFKISFARNKLSVYERALNILYSLYLTSPSPARLEDIFRMVERTKARAFLESLVETKIGDEKEVDPEMLSLEKRLSHEISSLNAAIAAPDTSARERNERLAELEIKEEEYLRLISNIKTDKRTQDAITPTINPSLAEVQINLLDQNGAILEYLVGDDRSYLFLLTSYSVELFTLPPKAELERSLKGYLKSLSSCPSGPFAGILASERIAQELVFPLGNKAHSGIRTLIVIPDGILHYLPFETLRMNDGSGPAYLVEKYKISYSPSASTLFFLEKWPRKHKHKKTLLAFGAPQCQEFMRPEGIQEMTSTGMSRGIYPDKMLALPVLPFSKDEILKVAKLFPTPQEDVFFGAQASETVLKKLPLHEYQIVHFACHGVLDDRLPFRSALALCPDNAQDKDGLLQVREISNLKMDAELVVLSACQTANGTLEQGEGLVGMTRSFFHAGGRSVLSSMWAINDRSAASFMEDFYSCLVRGQDKSSALRVAKLNMLKSKRAHPFYWAGFVLNGDPGPIRMETHESARQN